MLGALCNTHAQLLLLRFSYSEAPSGMFILACSAANASDCNCVLITSAYAVLALLFQT